jgi:hypothetical protein
MPTVKQLVGIVIAIAVAVVGATAIGITAIEHGMNCPGFAGGRLV